VDGFVRMAADLLSFAHTVFGPGFWPGDWVWATMAAGFIIALFPILASFVIAVIRKGTGNAYNPVTLSVFAGIGLVFALVLPWLMANGISTIFRSIAANDSAFGLEGMSPAFATEDFTLIGTQQAYLGSGQNVYEILTRPQGGFLYLVNLAKLVILPAASLLFVILQARSAFRRGPTWPGRFIWVSFAAFLLFSAPLSANVAFLLWIGFLPASVLGLIPILVIGSPSWSTINRSVQEKQQPQLQPAVQHQGSQHNQQPHQASQQQPPPPQPSQQKAQMHNQPPQKPPPYVPEPPPPPYRPDGLAPQLLSGQAGQELLSGRQQPGKLADTPGPLPFPLGGGAGVPPMPPPVAPQTRAMSGSGIWTQSGGRFQKVKTLGHGGFGTVWLAMDTQLDRTVAVKLAHAPDAETEQRMLREARALAAVRHPNCARVYDIVEGDDGLGIVMEYIEGKPLADAVHDAGKLDDLSAARLWVTMAGALSAAHAKGVLHRDIKPSNIMIDPSGMPHLIDFGIARSKGDSTLTKTGMMVGTPDFLAPETAAGSPATPASDAWQLAATVAYALTGEPPRGTRDNPMAALMAAAKAEAISHLPKNSVHSRLLAAALGPDPAGRPTLDTIIRQTGGWLTKGGHTEDGPVTKVVKRDELGLDRTKVTKPAADGEATKFTDPERTQAAKPTGRPPASPDLDRTQAARSSMKPVQQPMQPVSPDVERTRPTQKRNNPTKRFGT
jgi:eukaryotic-like serine/threonine-protein kinase